MQELSLRQLEVLQLRAEGLTNKQCAEVLGIGMESVKTHVCRILLRLSARSMTEAVHAGHSLGLIVPRKDSAAG